MITKHVMMHECMVTYDEAHVPMLLLDQIGNICKSQWESGSEESRKDDKERKYPHVSSEDHYNRGKSCANHSSKQTSPSPYFVAKLAKEWTRYKTQYPLASFYKSYYEVTVIPKSFNYHSRYDRLRE